MSYLFNEYGNHRSTTENHNLQYFNEDTHEEEHVDNIIDDCVQYLMSCLKIKIYNKEPDYGGLKLCFN